MNLFRIVSLVAAFALAAPPAQAQTVPKIGATGGVNFSSVSSYFLEFDGATGYHVGVYGNIGLSALDVRVSILYVSAGDVGVPRLDIPEFYDLTVTFIAVPVDFKFGVPLPVVKSYALIGPEARVVTGDFAGSDRVMNYAINAGIGAEFDVLVGPSVFAELRYGLDVTGINDDNTFKVNVFYVRVGIGL